MIKLFYAHVAVIAVSRPGWPKDIACIAEFYFLRMSFNSASVKYRLVLAD